MVYRESNINDFTEIALHIRKKLILGVIKMVKKIIALIVSLNEEISTLEIIFCDFLPENYFVKGTYTPSRGY